MLTLGLIFWVIEVEKERKAESPDRTRKREIVQPLIKASKIRLMNSAYRSPSVSSFSSTMPDTSLIVNYRKYQHLSISSTTLGALVMISQVHQEKKELILTIATKHRVLSAKLSCPSTSKHEFFLKSANHCYVWNTLPDSKVIPVSYYHMFHALPEHCHTIYRPQRRFLRHCICLDSDQVNFGQASR